jgi:hypothetical protein
MTAVTVFTWGDPEHEALAAGVRGNPACIEGSQKARLWRVFYKRIYYRWRNEAGQEFEFYIRFHSECNKDRCNTAEQEMMLRELVNWYDCRSPDEDEEAG